LNKKNNKKENDNIVCNNKIPSDEVLLAIAKLNILFSYFEEHVVDMTSLLFGCEPEAVANVCYPLPIKHKCQI
jgi:hypothetical protein